MRFLLRWAFLFLVCVVVRLPYLLGDHVYFDGDEAIVGIMARDFIHGDNFPVYFYGQRYGFAFFEVVAVAIFRLLLGPGVYALKLGALSLFSLGLAFVWKTLRNLQVKPGMAVLFVIVLCVFPLWFLWAAKVRGGYVTAFAALAGMSCFLSRSDTRTRDVILSAFFAALCAVSHLLLLLPFVPAVIYLLWKRLKPARRFLWCGLAIVAVVLLRLPACLNPSVWELEPEPHLSLTVLEQTAAVFPQVFMGYFYYGVVFPVPRWVGGIFVLQLFLFVLLLLRFTFKNKIPEKILVWLCLAVAAGCILFCVSVDPLGYRYFLGPVTAFAAVYLYLLYRYVESARSRFSVQFFAGVLFMAPVFAYGQIPAFWQAPQTPDMDALRRLNHELVQRNITGILCTDPLLAWQLNYYGNGKYAARYLFKKDRVQTFAQRVDDCHNTPGCRTAIVGIYGSARQMDELPGWHDSVIYVGERFYLQPAAKQEFLEKAGFVLP